MDRERDQGHEAADARTFSRREVVAKGAGIAGGIVLGAAASVTPAAASESAPEADDASSGRRREPRIVLPAFVVRGDTTPDTAVRVSRPGYFVNVEGEGIADPGARPRVPALEPDPELRWEAFDEYWRKVHGPKIIHRDGPGDRTTRLLLRYEQQHRLPAGPTSLAPPPYRPQVDASGLLVTDPWARVAGYKRPSFDGLAQLVFATRADLNAFFGLKPGDKYVDKIVPDEKVFLKGFAFNISKEFVRIPDRGSRAPVILVKTHRRRARLTRAAFRSYWLDAHAPLVESKRATRRLVRRYAQLHNVSVAADAPFYDPVGDRFDGVSVLSFANTNAVEDFLTSEDYAAIVADEETFTAESEYFTAINYTITDAGDERATT